MSLAKAHIKPIDPIRGVKGSFEVQFNPTEYSLQKGVQIAEIGIPGLDSPILQYVRGQNEKLTIDFFFDATRNDSYSSSGKNSNATTGEIKTIGEIRDVVKMTEPFYQLVKIQSKTHAPPRVEFIWGALKFKAIVESVQRKFTLFSDKGYPLRATLSITFRQYMTISEQLTRYNLQSPDHTHRHVVQQGETLQRIAIKAFNDPSYWRIIAEHNAISEPRDLIPGQELFIPALDPFGVPFSAEHRE